MEYQHLGFKSTLSPLHQRTLLRHVPLFQLLDGRFAYKQFSADWMSAMIQELRFGDMKEHPDGWIKSQITQFLDRFSAALHPEPLAQRYETVLNKIGSVVMEDPEHVANSEEAATVLRSGITDYSLENYLALYLNSVKHVIGYEVICIGTPSETHAQPRRVARTAIMLDASYVITAHNHPDGYAEPSADDYKSVKQTTRTLDAIGVKHLDHIILTETDTMSVAVYDYSVLQVED